MLPVLLPPSFTPLLTALAALSVADWVVTQYSPAEVFWIRIVQILRIASTGVWLFWVRGTLRADQSFAKRRHFWEPACWIALIAVAVAFASSAAGATALARYVTTGLVTATTGSILLYGFFRITQLLLHLMIETRAQTSGVAPLLWARETVAARVTTGIRWLALTGIAFIVLGAFRITEPVLSLVRATLAEEISFGAVSFTAGALMIIILVLTVGILLSRTLRFFLASGVYGRIALQRGTGEAVSKLVHYTILTAACLFALSATGIDLNRFTLLVGALGVGLGFGLQNVVNNFICGLILLFERPLKVGDIVSIDTVSGMVTDIGIRSTQIRTWDGADVSVPNANVVSKELTNWKGLNEHRGSELIVGVAYGTEAGQVIRILVETAQQHPRVLEDPAPSAFFAGFGDSSINFRLRFWTFIRDWMDVNSQMHTAVYQRLAAEGIEIPFPQREFRLKDAEAVMESIQSTTKQGNAAESP